MSGGPPRPKGVDAALQAQAAARANAEQQQKFMKELMQWEKKVKVKDDNLIQTKTIASALPPVRNSAPGPAESARPQRAKAKQMPKAQQKSIPQGDYRGWDRYDINKAIADADDEETEEVNEETEEHRTRLLREHKANEEKDKGNAQFKQGKYAAAIECYTRGMVFDPTSSALVANRAMARLKMKRYAEAEADCTLAIELSPKYVKAWRRRASARVALQKLESALDDYRMILKLDPTDKVAKREVKSLPQRIVDAKEKARQAFRPLAHVGDTTTLSTAKTSQTLHRIPIEEIGGSDEEGPAQGAPAEAVVTVASPSVGTPAAAEPPLVAPSKATPRKVQIVEVDETDSSDEDTPTPSAKVVQPQQATAAAAAPPQCLPARSSPAITAVAPQRVQPANSAATAQPPPQAVTSGATATRKKAARQPTKARSVAAAGKMTSARFETSWRRCDAKGMLALLQSLKPTQLPGLIKNNLCAELIASIFGALALNPSTGAIDELGVLEALAKTRRFDQTLMFLDDKELEPLRAVVSAIRTGNSDEERLARVAGLYGL